MGMIERNGRGGCGGCEESARFRAAVGRGRERERKVEVMRMERRRKRVGDAGI